MHKPLRTLVNAAVLSIIAVNVAHAAGFSLYGESNGAAIGNYAAGLAAEAADASTGWYNPAGLVLIHEQQFVFSGVGVFPSTSLNGTSTFTTLAPPNPNPINYVQTFSDLTTAENGFVPSFHYALPLGPGATFGLSVTSPFGLSSDYVPDSAVRYEATYSELITVNVSPELGVLLTDNFSFGAGLDLQYARVKFNRMLGAPTIAQLFVPDDPAVLDSLSYNKGHSYGVGFHAGVMGMFHDNHTRIGLNYQSEMNHTFYGFSRLTGDLASPSNIFDPGTYTSGTFTSNNLFSNHIKLPSIVTLSAYQDVNDKLALLGSVVFTGWNVFKTIQLNNVAAAVVNPPGLPVGTILPSVLNASSPQNYDDAWRVMVGANYHVNDRLMLRVGGGYDQTPTNDTDRDVRLPDSDRIAIAIGARYWIKSNISVDAGYSHLFGVNAGGIDRTDIAGETSIYNVVADFSSSADLVGLQLNWVMDQPVAAAPMK